MLPHGHRFGRDTGSIMKTEAETPPQKHLEQAVDIGGRSARVTGSKLI
jgi:hypothetical protein